jgi:mannan endo-1,4-beta-mannosidase
MSARRALVLAFSAAVLAAFVWHQAFRYAPTFTVRGRELVDRCGKPVVLRGVNKMNIWTDPDGSLSFPEIKKTGANSVRIVWDGTGDAKTLDAAISRAAALGLLPMIENHDATGDFDKLPSLVDYWLRPDILAVLRKHEAHLLLNIGNEVGDEHVSDAAFRDGYAQAVRRLREVGLRLPLVIDGTFVGRNIDILQRNGAALIAADPVHNLLFSVHMWWMDSPSERYEAEIRESAELSLPLVVGEFGHKGGGCRGRIDYRAIMAACQKYGVGYLAWEWGPGNLACPELDMTENNEYRLLREWGREVVERDPNGIKRTARPIECL